MSGRLDGQRVIVTGGAGAAGAAAVRLFTAEGPAVAIVDMAADRGQALVVELTAQGAKATFQEVDVSDEASVTTGLAAAIDDLGGIDVLFNHAGIIYTGPLVDMSLEDWDRINSINVTRCSSPVVRSCRR